MGPQVDRTLAAEQKKTDFQPKGGGGAGPDLERPPGAALLATAMLRAAARVASGHLHGTNLTSFLGQVPLPSLCPSPSSSLSPIPLPLFLLAPTPHTSESRS